MRITMGAVALAAVMAAVAGCGGDDPDPAPATPPSKSPSRGALSKPEYIRQADAICADADRLLGPLERSTAEKATQGDARGTAEDIRKSVRIADGQLAKLRALAPPPDDQTAVDAYFDTITEQIGLTRGLADAIEAGNGERTKSLSAELASGKQRAQGQAKEFGFQECGNAD